MWCGRGNGNCYGDHRLSWGWGCLPAEPCPVVSDHDSDVEFLDDNPTEPSDFHEVPATVSAVEEFGGSQLDFVFQDPQGDKPSPMRPKFSAETQQPKKKDVRMSRARSDPQTEFWRQRRITNQYCDLVHLRRRAAVRKIRRLKSRSRKSALVCSSPPLDSRYPVDGFETAMDIDCVDLDDVEMGDVDKDAKDGLSCLDCRYLEALPMYPYLAEMCTFRGLFGGFRVRFVDMDRYLHQLKLRRLI